MKRHGKLFAEFCSFKNLLAASQAAQRAKRYAVSTSRFNFQLEQNLLRLRAALLDGTYRCGPYTNFYIYEPKQRFISAAPYVDRVVHHALCQIIGPIFEKTFVFDLYSNRASKGTHKAVDQYQRFCRLNPYVLKCDVSKYFASVDQAVLFEVIQRKIKDQRLLAIIKQVIDGFVNEQQGKGMPLGNLTSQLFANIYLSPLDHFIQRDLACKHYIRYTDDWVVFADSKQRLHEIRSRITEFLQTYRLTFHPTKTRVYRVCDGVMFLGYRMFPTHRLVNQANVKRFKRRVKKLQEHFRGGQLKVSELLASLHSWNAHAAHANSYRLRQQLYDAYTFSKG